MEEKNIIVTEQSRGTRLDTYVASLDLNMSRSMVKKLIEAKKIMVNGQTQKDSYKVKENDEIKIILEEPKESDIKAEDIPLDIIYEDEDIIVVNKEKGMVVHPGNGNTQGTLVNAIMAHCKGSLSGIGGELRPRDCS